MQDSTYRPISSYAVAAYCFAPLSLVGFAIPELIVVSGIVLVLVIIAAIQITFYQFAGRRLAMSACVAALFTAFEIPYWHHCNYESETLPGYRREDFEKLASKKELGSLVGQPLCLKGQVVFGSSSMGTVQSFLFAPFVDGFGTEPILRVELSSDVGWYNTYKRIAVSGVLAENDRWIPGSQEPKFVLRHAFVRLSRTRY